MFNNTVQIYVLFDKSTGYTFADFADTTNNINITSDTKNISIRRRRDLTSDQYQAGTCKIRVYDTNGDWNPQNTSSPLYGQQVPMKKLQIWARKYVGGGGYNDYNIWRGYVDSYNYSYPTNQEIGYLDISATDAIRVLNTIGITTVTGATAGETTGSRFQKILNTISWPSSLYDTSTGANATTTPIMDDPGTSRSALAALNEVAFTEQGRFVCSRNGYLSFTSHTDLQLITGDATAATFTNGTITDATTQFPYTNVKFNTVDNLLYNQTQVKRTAGALQTYQTASSVASYGLKNYYHDGSLSYTDTDAYQVAAMYTMGRDIPQFRVDDVTVKLSAVVNQTPDYSGRTLMGLDLGSKIRVINIQNTGSTVDLTQYVVSVNHDITPTEWTMSFGTYTPTVTGFILDSTTEGILDTSRLGW